MLRWVLKVKQHSRLRSACRRLLAGSSRGLMRWRNKHGQAVRGLRVDICGDRACGDRGGKRRGQEAQEGARVAPADAWSGGPPLQRLLYRRSPMHGAVVTALSVLGGEEGMWASPVPGRHVRRGDPYGWLRSVCGEGRRAGDEGGMGGRWCQSWWCRMCGSGASSAPM